MKSSTKSGAKAQTKKNKSKSKPTKGSKPTKKAKVAKAEKVVKPKKVEVVPEKPLKGSKAILAAQAKAKEQHAKKHVSFVELVIKGKASVDDVDNYIDLWHETENPFLLHEFLGMTFAEYKQFCTNASTLPDIIEKKAKKSAGKEVKEEAPAQ